MAATDGCNDDGWSPYSDEKCFKVFQHATTSFDEAEAFCEQQIENGGGGGNEDDNEPLKSDSNFQVVPRLLTIDNAGQQAFVEKLLFEKNSIDNNSNIWLGAKFEKKNDDDYFGGYYWRRNYGRNGGGVELDKEDVADSPRKVFTWWNNDFPKYENRHNGYCMEMLTKSKKGEWVQEKCANQPKSHVVCERRQLWPTVKLQERLIKLEEHLFNFIQKVLCTLDRKTINKCDLDVVNW